MSTDGLLDALWKLLDHYDVEYEDFLALLALDMHQRADREPDHLVAELLSSAGHHLTGAAFDWYASTK